MVQSNEEVQIMEDNRKVVFNDAAKKIDKLQGLIFDMQTEIEQMIMSSQYKRTDFFARDGLQEALQLLKCTELISMSFVNMLDAHVTMMELTGVDSQN